VLAFNQLSEQLRKMLRHKRLCHQNALQPGACCTIGLYVPV
jgi:hypothetical protein